MHVGKVPFSSPIEANVFQKILDLDFSWPQDLEVSSEAKDLVERLLKINPGHRIGAGAPGTPNDYTMLMKHPYFSRIDFDNLQNITPPLVLP